MQKSRSHRYAKITPPSVLKTNNSSERVMLGIISPPNLNISATTCSYVGNEQIINEQNPLVNCGIFEYDRTRELNSANL